MTKKMYEVGFEDGFHNAVCRDENMTQQEAFAYRSGFKAGMKARDEYEAANC